MGDGAERETDLLKLFHNPKQKVKFHAHVNEAHSHSQVRNYRQKDRLKEICGVIMSKNERRN